MAIHHNESFVHFIQFIYFTSLKQDFVLLRGIQKKNTSNWNLFSLNQRQHRRFESQNSINTHIYVRTHLCKAFGRLFWGGNVILFQAQGLGLNSSGGGEEPPQITVVVQWCFMSTWSLNLLVKSLNFWLIRAKNFYPVELRVSYMLLGTFQLYSSNNVCLNNSFRVTRNVPLSS